jgi:hypothetical protein
MKWVVCENKISRELVVMHRRMREAVLTACRFEGRQPESRVVALFQTELEAEQWVAEIQAVDGLLAQIFKNNLP